MSVECEEVVNHWTMDIVLVSAAELKTANEGLW